MDKIRILVVDNEEDWRFIWMDELRRHGGFSVDIAEDFLKATSLIAERVYEGAIIDKGGRDLIEKPSPAYDYHDGLRLIKQLKEEQPFCRIVLETGEAFSRSVFDCGAAVFLNKGYVAEYNDEVVKFLSKGALQKEEINRPIIDWSGRNEIKHLGVERW